MKQLTFILSILIICSCQSNSKDKNTVEVFYPTGELMITVDTLNNYLVGPLNYYNKSGEIISTQSWINGRYENELEFYDDNLIDFYSVYLILKIDSILYAGEKHEFELINFPEHITLLSTDNGKISRQDDKWILEPETPDNDMDLVFYANFNGQNKQIKRVKMEIRNIK